MGRIVAIDYGLKRIGVAISDAGKKIAFPLTTTSNLKGLEEALAPHRSTLEKILVGLPLLLSGKDSPMTTTVRQFAEKLQTLFSVPVELVDERFSSKIADQSLRELHLKRKKRSETMDTTAATMLLQEYLDGNTH